MKFALIFNPYSGGKKSHQFLPLVHKRLNQPQNTIDLFTSEYHGHLQQIAAALNVEKYDAILTMGGDGTHFHVLNGLLSKNKAHTLPLLGIIPAGTGNSFVKDLDIFTVQDSLDAICKMHYKWVDVCSYTQGENRVYFVNNLGLGFVTDAVRKAMFFKRFKQAGYLIGVVLNTIGLTFHTMELTVDDQHMCEQNCLLAVCNSRYIGGNMLIAPDARLDDGLFDIVILSPLSRFQLLKALPLIFSGEHIHHPAVRTLRARHIEFKTRPEKQLSPDGELSGTTPASVSIHPKLLRYLC